MKRIVLAIIAKLPYPLIDNISHLMLKLLGVGRIPTIQEEIKFLGMLASDLGEFVFLDIGANEGFYSLEFSRRFPNISIYAFEPGSTAFSILKTKTHNTRISCINRGIGEKATTLDLYYDFSGSGLASLSQRNLSHMNIDFNLKETISIVTLDEWLIDNKILEKVVIKMDIEGHEFFALKGASEALKTKIQLIQFEFGGANIDSKTYFIDLWNLLNLDYDIFKLTSNGLRLVKNYSENCEFFLNTTYYAKRKAKHLFH